VSAASVSDARNFDEPQTVGQALVLSLAQRGVDVVFGIPGVHTIELYRGLANSGIRHVTARHEQGLGFMADGYARVSGRPGVAFVITGPGVTNILTAMAQARADSVPMLVVSSVNARESLARGLGYLHELPDQQALMAQVALTSERIEMPSDVGPALDRAFATMLSGRPGPVHIEVPLDVLQLPAGSLSPPAQLPATPMPKFKELEAATFRLEVARRCVILAGGGARRAEAALARLAEMLDAPVVQTINARGMMSGHPLTVAASPSLEAVRALMLDADQILTVGTEIGPTDYDMYGRGGLPDLSQMIRIDIDRTQLNKHRTAVGLHGDAGEVLTTLAEMVTREPTNFGAARARQAVDGALEEVGPEIRAQIMMVQTIRDALPGSVIVGDSTAPVYAGNLIYEHDRSGGWFNAATGYGALGYAPGAAVGAALAAEGRSVVCLIGDGGLQFSPGELMTAVDEALPIIFVVWNNYGFNEIALAMRRAGVPVLGCDPKPPRHDQLAMAYRMPFISVAPEPAALCEVLKQSSEGPKLIEIVIE